MSSRRQTCSTRREWFQQGMIRSRQRQARNGRLHEDRKRKEVGASDNGVPAGKVLLEVPPAEQEEDGRDEVGVDVDRLVVHVRPAAEGGASRARDGPVAMEDPPVGLAPEPLRHVVEREEDRAPCCLAGLERPGGAGAVGGFHILPFVWRLWWLWGRNS